MVVTLRAQKEDWRDTSQKRFNIIILDKCVHLALLCAIIILQTRAKLGTWSVDYCSFNASTYRLCLKCEQFIALLKIYFVLLLMSILLNYVWFLKKNPSILFILLNFVPSSRDMINLFQSCLSKCIAICQLSNRAFRLKLSILFNLWND